MPCRPTFAVMTGNEKVRMALVSHMHSVAKPMARPRTRSGKSSESATHTGALRKACMKNTKLTQRIRMSQARSELADRMVAVSVMRTWRIVVMQKPKIIILRRE